MPTRYLYQTTIRNEYLGVSKVIRAMSADELDWLVDAQLTKWREQERRKREQRRKEADRRAAQREAEGLRSQAEADTAAAQEKLDAYRNILRAGLPTNLAIRWEELLDRRAYPAFQFSLEKPNRDLIRLRLLGPEPEQRYVGPPRRERPGPFDILLPFLRTRRRAREKAAREAYEAEQRKAEAEYQKSLKRYRAREPEVVAAYNRAAQEYNARLKAAKQDYLRGRNEFIAQQKAHNDAILAFRSRYEAGSAEAVERYVQMALEKSSYPDGIAGEPDVQFDEPSKTLVVNFRLPGPGDVPNVLEYKYVATRKSVKPVEMKQKDFEAYYDDVLHQIALRTVHEVFVADYAARVEAVVYNGWVGGIDGKTGKPFTSCILSCEVSRKQYTELDLSRVSPKECVRSLKGITAGPLAMLAPVKPIMDINKDDDRFVESKPVMEHLGSQDNLAAMEWEDFEHLVRELFEKEFGKTGGEVRVTQASRDRGVDAIAFDPDPIRGGKFVIQAKRYNVVVPVSAVRDLYGTMIAEGATKGILVTTSYFGRDSREFAKDKPITLIDGENLVYMFQKHGRDLHISLLPKGDPRRGLGQPSL
jgi:restriction system protein